MELVIGARVTPQRAGTPRKKEDPDRMGGRFGREPPGRSPHLEAFSYFLLKRSTRPAVSTSFCFPV